MKDIIKKIKKNLFISNFIFRITSSWIIVFLINWFTNKNYNDINYADNINFFLSIIYFIFTFIIISFISIKNNKKNIDYYICIVSFVLFSTISIKESNGFFYIITLFLFFLLLFNYNLNKANLSKNEISNKKTTFVIIIELISMFIFIATISVLRYKNFYSPNFDLGIPAQNFYYLKKLLIPLSTCERDTLISHFAIHISPIYYLLVPIYNIFTKTETLQVLSGLIIASSLIPIYLITKRKKMPNYVKIIICSIFLIYSPAICSTYYDFHENLFLTPLLLWLFYFYELKNNLLFLIFLILTCLVKEDAGIYIVLFGIYMIFDNNKSKGIKTIIAGIIAFSISTFLLNTYGTGIMSDRYDNLIPNNQGLFGIIKTIFINPAYFLNQLTLSNENNYFQKIKYIIQLFLPLGFLPFKTKKWKNYCLLLPLLLTIMTTYNYSYDITFHYSCGIIAFLFYLFILNVEELKKYNYLLVCLFGSFILFVNCCLNEYLSNLNEYYNSYKEKNEVENALKSIPINASVNASTYLLPHLANRDTIYEVYYHKNKKDIDYLVLDARYDDYQPIYKEYIMNGYSEYLRIENKIIILKK